LFKDFFCELLCCGEPAIFMPIFDGDLVGDFEPERA
jgi:hypothetical protein